MRGLFVVAALVLAGCSTRVAPSPTVGAGAPRSRRGSPGADRPRGPGLAAIRVLCYLFSVSSRSATAAVMARLGSAGRRATRARARVVAATLRRDAPFSAEELA